MSEIWSPISPDHLDWASATMTRDRFQLISANITFDNVSSRNSRAHDKFHKISEIFNEFAKNCRDGLSPGKNLTVDEELYGFRGRCSFKQYMPSKPSRYGLKYFCCVDVATSYLCNIEVYLGKVTQSQRRQVNLGEQMVLRLTEPYFNQAKRNLTTDNYFTSIPLANKLYEKRIHLIGTLRCNKPEIPSDFLPNKNREVGSSIFGFDGFKTIVSYVPKKSRAVILVSTAHHSNSIDSYTNKPDIIMHYNKTKGGVDTLDHLVANFTCRRKTNRWPFNVFMFMLDVAAYNAFALTKIKNHEEFNHNLFRQRRESIKDLSKKLIQPCITFRNSEASKSRYTGMHSTLLESFKRTGQEILMQIIPSSRNSKGAKRSRCAVSSCLTRKKNNVYPNKCIQCTRFFCGDHIKIHKTIICTDCSEK